MSGPEVRPAETGDLPALVGLRAEMFKAMGVPETEPQWRAQAALWLGERIDHPDHHLVVVEHEGRVVSCALGSLTESAPTPARAWGWDLHVSNVCTHPDHRGRGFGRIALRAVLDWGRSQPGPVRAKLFATAFGRAMYEKAGFAEVTWPAMRADLS
ncbi:GNAT family N-acetyltransferase [Kineosporia sp. J2-2]|uniref:GNAT family N-acetyltransferase n=1 Tax=Kineosporia corallincola TaxID=2835133 RepID=A0ABS5TPP2_9ACTN|nr:GNAT family N-acetyltransferase [Kineosporia corallincola]MBT0772793.1 GNAT family N-acetyltransferase [Kineosporia corallincola]